MKTVGIPYLGSKRALVQNILDIIQKECVGVKKVLDVMTGTTRVAQAFLAAGYDTLTSDTSEASACYASAFLERPAIDSLELERLNDLAPLADDGWLTRTYCEARAAADASPTIRVFQPHNGRKADAIREAIVGHPHETALVGMLILALSRVENTVGHHQAYLKNWAARTCRPLSMQIPSGLPAKMGTYLGHILGDALSIDYPEADLAYVDPPYSQHPYKSCFHIWDSIALWDKPDVGLSTNRRLDRVGTPSIKSPWNSKKTAGRAFDALFARLKVKYILVSYSEDALLSLETLRSIAAKHGEVKIFTEPNHKKNIMSKIGNAQDQTQPLRTVKEYFLLIRRAQSPKKI